MMVGMTTTVRIIMELVDSLRMEDQLKFRIK